jgi:hypothetical protein
MGLDRRPAIAAMSGPLVFIFLLAKGLSGKPVTKEASLYLVVPSGLLAILLTASRQFNWLDVLVSTAATLPVVLRHVRRTTNARRAGKPAAGHRARLTTLGIAALHGSLVAKRR